MVIPGKIGFLISPYLPGIKTG